MAETPVTNFRIPQWLRDKARAVAQERGMTLTDAVIEALTDWIRKQERRQRQSKSPAAPTGTG